MVSRIITRAPPAGSSASAGLGDRPVAGVWDGDGRTDLGVLRGNRMFLQVNGRNLPSFVFGVLGDLPLAGNWHHDGVDTVGLFHAATGTWNFRAGDCTTRRTVFGSPGDQLFLRRTRALAPGCFTRST